jgi:hypothetical protein
MKDTALVITSIADQHHPVLNQFAAAATRENVSFILVGDTKSPREFELQGCDFYSIQRQQELSFQLSKILPTKHYARKNIGYLVAIKNGAKVIIESDDDNIPLPGFWDVRSKSVDASLLLRQGWVNVYKYFSEHHIWPRGFALEHVQDKLPALVASSKINCPIQQGLADDNPDVDAIYRLILPLPIVFNQSQSVALGEGAICPFNSQNTSWFQEAFPLLYLPSYCSFRMTDIWRSFVAQRIAWTCGWSILFHRTTVRQERNEHNLMHDFRDEIPGYTNNLQLFKGLEELKLTDGPENIPSNMIACYRKLIEMGLVNSAELQLVEAWLSDLASL